MQRYLLDTNAIIYLIGGRLDAPLPSGQYSFSVISEIELLSFPGLSAEDDQKITELLTGQDGSYLAEFLLEKGYIVHGIKRRASSFNTQRVDHIYQDPHVNNAHFKLHYGDLSDTSNLVRIVQETQPDDIYNLGAQSHVAKMYAY